MWKCKYCKKLFNETIPFKKANHMRWCYKNPKRKEYVEKLEQTRKKITKSSIELMKESLRLAWKNGKYKNVDCRKRNPSRIPWNKGIINAYKHTDEAKEKISLNNKGGRCKWYTVNKQKVQGTWERDIAKTLSKHNIRWEKCNLSKHSMSYIKNNKVHKYIPDFYLFYYDLYLEIKGYWRETDKEKMKHVIEQNPDKKIMIIDNEKYLNFLITPLVQLERTLVFEIRA